MIQIKLTPRTKIGLIFNLHFITKQKKVHFYWKPHVTQLIMASLHEYRATWPYWNIANYLWIIGHILHRRVTVWSFVPCTYLQASSDRIPIWLKSIAHDDIKHQTQLEVRSSMKMKISCHRVLKINNLPTLLLLYQ